VLAEELRKRGLTLDDVKQVNMDVATALTAFLGNQGDGLGSFNTVALKALDAGLVGVADFDTPNAVMATPSAIADKRDLLTAAYIVFYRTGEWLKSSPENQKKAAGYLLESSLDEGIKISADLAMRTMQRFTPVPLDQDIKEMVDVAPDSTGTYTKRPISIAEQSVLLNMMNFYIQQKKYSDADRIRIFDQKLIDPAIAMDAAKMVKDLSISGARK
jgi:ABC-type nitrate/sulfonate/bicarbonate transport system substrate-binding protein